MRNLGIVSLALVNLTAAMSLTALPAYAGEIDLDNADSGEIRSHLEDLRQRRTSEEERLDRLKAERSELNAVIEESERDFGAIPAQLERATEALDAASGGFSGKIEALSDFRVEQARRYDIVVQSSERLEAVGPEISRSAEAIEKLAGDISRAESALEEAEMAEARARATASADRATASADRAAASADPPESANSVVQYAYDQLGKPYGFGKTGPDAYDCSGLVSAAYAQSGVSLSRTSHGQWSDSTAISRSDLVPGDLVFSYGTGHIAIYIGGDQVIHASKPGDTVKVAMIDVMPVSGYRRVRE